MRASRAAPAAMPPPAADGRPDAQPSEMKTIPTTASTTAARPSRGRDSRSTAPRQQHGHDGVHAGQGGGHAHRQGAARQHEGRVAGDVHGARQQDDRPGRAQAAVSAAHPAPPRRSARWPPRGWRRVPMPRILTPRQRRRAAGTRGRRRPLPAIPSSTARGLDALPRGAAGGADGGHGDHHAEPLAGDTGARPSGSRAAAAARPSQRRTGR